MIEIETFTKSTENSMVNNASHRFILSTEVAFSVVLILLAIVILLFQSFV